MKTRALSLLIALAIVFSLGFASIGAATTYEYPLLGTSPQQNLRFCGPSVAQAWTHVLTWNWYSQYTFADVVPTVHNGTHAGEMAEMLNYFAGNGRWFYYTLNYEIALAKTFQ